MESAIESGSIPLPDGPDGRGSAGFGEQSRSSFGGQMDGIGVLHETPVFRRDSCGTPQEFGMGVALS